MLGNSIDAVADKSSAIHLFDTFAQSKKANKQVNYYKVDTIEESNAAEEDMLPVSLQSSDLVIDLLNIVPPIELEQVRTGARGAD